MASWRDDKILELANQLTYSPAEKRREQLQFVIDLLPTIDPAKSYPWDFVHFRITSFQPRTHIDHVVAGNVLRADLASLIEFLSDTLSIRVEEAAANGDAVLELEDVTRKFSVSSKTIQRWRKQGLIALRYLYPDGRRRLGFLESVVARFAADNRERVEKSANFKQLTEDEKKTIIEMAHRLAAHGNTCIKDISRCIGRQLQRSPETIRYTIRRHDKEHPENAVFAEPGAEPACKRTPDEPDVVLEAVEPTPQHLLRLQHEPIDYMPNPLFDHPDADNIILKVLPQEALARAQASVAAGANAKASDVYMARLPRDLPAFLQDIFRQPVMPQELEIDCFRRMNYLKFRAARLQKNLNPLNPAASELAEIESLLAQSQELKNLILQSNLRVAVHVARKHQRADRPLIELVSDATIWVMRAIEKFDFARPTRFSTYAGYAIMKNFARDRAEQLTRRDARHVTGQEELLGAIADPQPDAQAEQLDAAALHSDLHTVLEDLSPRDRELLKQHYGLDKAQPALSLSEISSQMGLTKTRVQQLEARALCKLRQLMETRREKIRKASATRRK
ncbi:MAG TPA: sigma-70 family RNA polymerase sigma factor [Phycisphaerae bacterium]|nr:sigma-70 family RNA polymerase sigma factor [Phycisphaerae bacterium]